MNFAHEHLFFAVLTFIALVLGAALHTWVVASNTVNSKTNGIATYQQYFALFLPPIMYRFALSWAIFLVYAENSDAICKLAAQNFSSLSWLANHPVHVGPITGLIYGLFMDSLLNPIITFAGRWIPGLKVDIPPPPGYAPSVKP